MRRILGMFPNVPGSSIGAESCALSCWSRCFGTDVIVRCLPNLESGMDNVLEKSKAAVSLPGYHGSCCGDISRSWGTEAHLCGMICRRDQGPVFSAWIPLAMILRFSEC